MSLNIKLIFNNEIHRLSKIPSSYAELQNYCTSVFRFSSFVLKYLDEENDEITIACDSDLFTALASAESLNLKSLRIHASLPNQNASAYPPSSQASNSGTFKAQPEKEVLETNKYEDYSYEECKDEEMSEEKPENPVIWQRHTCDGCDKKPIIGSRYHCTVCDDFDFCEECERNKQHDHPFMKFNKKTNDQYINIDLNPENMFEQFKILKKMFFKKKEKFEVKDYKKSTENGTKKISLKWTITNNGPFQWPAGCRVAVLERCDNVCFNEVPQLFPGQEIDFIGTILNSTGKIYGKWAIVTPCGEKLAILIANGIDDQEYQGKVEIMSEMGFHPDVAEEALKKYGGDLEKAIFSLS